MLNLARSRIVWLPPARTRSLASVSPTSPIHPSSNPFQVFDRNVKRMQKDRAAARDGGERSKTVDYVRNEIADRLIERMQVRRYPEWLANPPYNVCTCRTSNANSTPSSILGLGLDIFPNYLTQK